MEETTEPKPIVFKPDCICHDWEQSILKYSDDTEISFIEGAASITVKEIKAALKEESQNLNKFPFWTKLFEYVKNHPRVKHNGIWSKDNPPVCMKCGKNWKVIN